MKTLKTYNQLFENEKDDKFYRDKMEKLIFVPFESEYDYIRDFVTRWISENTPYLKQYGYAEISSEMSISEIKQFLKDYRRDIPILSNMNKFNI